MLINWAKGHFPLGGIFRAERHFLLLKATSHSTIFDIPTRPLREDQRHRQRFTR